MATDIEAYFEKCVLPLIERTHPEAVSEMSVRIEGSVGLGVDDEYSDLDAMIFLPFDLWSRSGASLQLSLIHSLEPFRTQSKGSSESPGDPFSWPVFGHPEINVHPRNELIHGQAEDVLDGKTEVPWDEMDIEELHQIQSCTILNDSNQFLSRLKAKTAGTKFPKELWTKRLIFELSDLKGEPWDFEKAVLRGRTLEAQMILGTILPAILRIVYLINRRYHPWRKYLVPFFHDLPFGPRELGPEIESLEAATDWDQRITALNIVLRIVTDEILAGDIVSASMLEYLFDAKNGKAWENPDWRADSDKNRRSAELAGYDGADGWIWGWWGKGASK